MQRRLAIVATVTTAAFLALSAPAHAASSISGAQLTGAAEVPGPGDPDGKGWAQVIALPGQGKVCYFVFVRMIEAATAAHIHEGAADESGPVVVTLNAPAPGASGGCVDTDEAADIAENPEDYYVNVHNAAYPAGAVRGQLS